MARDFDPNDPYRRAPGTRLPTPGATTATSTDPYAAFWAFYGIDPEGPNADVVRARIAGGDSVTDAFEYVAALTGSGPFADEPAPTGGTGRTQFASERERDIAAAELARAQAGAIITPEERAIDRAQELEIEAAREQGALKRQRLSVLQDLIGNFMSAQESATETLANLQPDFFRFAAAAQGLPVFGTTPTAGFEQALQEFTQRPIPTVSPDAEMPIIEDAIAGLTGARIPLAPEVFGV